MFQSAHHAARALALVAALSATAAAAAVEVKSVRSPGGIEAWLVEDHANPIIAMDVWWRGGSATDPADKGGLSNFLAATMDEGAGDLDSQAFRRRLVDQSISLGFGASRDGFTGRLKTLTKNRAEAFELFRLALTEPRFDAEPVERIRAQLIADLNWQETQASVIAGKAWWKAAFPDHPYGRPAGGTIKSVRALTAEDLRASRAQRLARDTLVVSIAGDITAEELGPLLDATFGALPEVASLSALPNAAPSDAAGLIVLPLDTPQSTAQFGHAGVKRNHPDYYIATVMNAILGGGGFTSRLYEEVREKRGLAYGVYSYLNPMQSAGLMMGGVSTQNARMAESLEVIGAEWSRLHDEGPTKDEVIKAIRNITGSFALRLTSTGGIVRMLTAMQIHDLGLDYLDRRTALYEAITVEDARRVAGALLAPDKLLTVVVGAPEGVRPTL